MVFPSQTKVFYKALELSFQLVSPTHSVVAACLGRRALLCGRMEFQILYGRNRLYTLLVTSGNGYPSGVGAQKCALEAWPAFVVVRIPSVRDGVSPDLHLRVTVLVVGGLVSG